MVEDGSILVPLEDLAKNPYKDLLAYPNPSDESVESRIRQLKSLGIEGLEFEGPLRMGKLSVLGKGVVGLVFRGIAENRRDRRRLCPRPTAFPFSMDLDRKSTRLNSSHSQISYAVFCL